MKSNHCAHTKQIIINLNIMLTCHAIFKRFFWFIGKNHAFFSFLIRLFYACVPPGDSINAYYGEMVV